MRSVRSVVVLLSTVAVMACQTAAGTVANAKPVSPVYGALSSNASFAAKGTIAVAQTRAKAAAPAADAGSKKKTIIFVAVVAAAVVAAVLLLSGDSYDSSY